MNRILKASIYLFLGTSDVVWIDQEILSLNPDKLEIDPKTKMLIKKLLSVLEQFAKEIAELREKNQKLRDEIRWLEGQPR